MPRLNRPTTNTNPATKFLEWKSNDENFSFYDKESGANIPVDLPLKFLFMEHYHTVKGFNDDAQSGIWSNEVYAIGTQEMKVQIFKGGTIGQGLYKEIKPAVNAAGGVYHRSIYVMTEGGELINISIKGAAVSAWSEFYKENSHLLDNQWIEVAKAEKKKKGSVNYTVPVFSIGKTISRDADKTAGEVAASLQSYMDNYFGVEPAPVAAGVEELTDRDYMDLGDLPL